MSQDNMIYFQEEDGTKTGFFVLEETKINGINYLLVTDSEEDEAEAWIMQEISEEDAEEKIYRPVEKEEELSYLSKIFAELLEDVEFETM